MSADKNRDREIEELWRRIRSLEQQIAQRPLRVPPGGSFNIYTVQIIGGNTLSTGEAGCKYSTSAITTVPSLYDANVDTSFVDGICRGLLFKNGVSQATNVLVLNDSTTPIQRAFIQNDVVAVQTPVSIALASDATQSITIYPALFL